jgi:Ca-activated chloride channel family protein
LAVAAAAATVQAAQETSGGRVFRAGVELVPVTVTVEDDAGGLVRNLEQTDFRLYEDGQPRQIAFFAAGTSPIDLYVMLDTSASMGALLPRARAGIERLMASLTPDDRVALLTFGTRLETVQPLTADRTALARALDATVAHGDTPLYDALYIALRELTGAGSRAATGAVRRRALVVLSDGVDTTSLIAYDAVLDAARRSGIATYAISAAIGKVDRFSKASGEMQMLARETGARWYPLSRRETLDAVCDAIAREIAVQYSLGFVPGPAPRDRFRRIDVTVDAPHARVRHRSGYIAAGGDIRGVGSN